MSARAITTAALLLGMCAATFMQEGCATLRGPAQESPRQMEGAEIGQRVTEAELDELTRAFADRYVGLLFSVCGALREGNPDPAQRRAAQVLLADNATNVYDIASNGDAFTRLLDLVVVTTLVSQVWDEDGRAVAVFGERGRKLSEALSRARAEARTLAARVLTADQLNILDTLLSDWREENPEVVRASFVRFSNFAIGRGRSAASEVLEARGLFAEVGEAGQAVDKARLLGERMFYWLKRAPTLARMQAGAMKADLAATPELGTALADLTRLTDQIEQLPANLAAERKAALAGLEDTLRDVDATITNGRAALDEARSLVTSVEPASESLGGMIESADALFTRFDAWDRWRAETQSAPFEIREYTEAIRELSVTAEKMDEMLTTSDSLLSSPAWDRRIRAVNVSADGRLAMAADQSQLVLDAFFWRACALLGVLFAMLILYRLLSLTLMRKLRPREERPLRESPRRSG